MLMDSNLLVGTQWINLKPLRNWCLQILPTVFDDSMSYYELLCKVIEITNGNISNLNLLKDSVNTNSDAIVQLQIEFEKVLGTNFIELIQNAINVAIKNVWFGLTKTGYFVAYIPDSWHSIKFNTSGYDVNIPNVKYGHLILSESEDN